LLELELTLGAVGQREDRGAVVAVLFPGRAGVDRWLELGGGEAPTQGAVRDAQHTRGLAGGDGIEILRLHAPQHRV
jgi:hypothetical protein